MKSEFRGFGWGWSLWVEQIYSRPLANLSDSLLSSESEPDEVKGATHTYEQANQGQHAGAEELIGGEADSTPEEKP